jgi:hypothetical protein
MLMAMAVALFSVAVNTAGTKNPKPIPTPKMPNTTTQVPYVVSNSTFHRPEYEFAKEKTTKFVYGSDGSCGVCLSFKKLTNLLHVEKILCL